MKPNVYYNAPYIDPAEHAALNHAGVPGVGEVTSRVLGPFHLAWNTANIDTGVTLWTPAVGDRIMGLWAEFTTAFNIADEQIGLGIAGTTDADLGFKFPVDSIPPATPTWDRVSGFGLGFGLGADRLLTTAPIVARTVIGGNSAGSLELYVMVLTL